MHPSFARIRATALLAVAGLAGTALAVGYGASAQSPETRTLTLREPGKGATSTHIRNTKTKWPRANLQGDVIAFTNPLVDDAGKAGKVSVACTTTTGSRNVMKSVVTCVGVLDLRDGSLMLQLNVDVRRSTNTGAITGGTGAYANARGVLVNKATKSGAVDTITLAG